MATDKKSVVFTKWQNPQDDRLNNCAITIREVPIGDISFPV